MSEEIRPFQLIPIPGLGPISVLPGGPGIAVEIIKRDVPWEIVKAGEQAAGGAAQAIGGAIEQARINFDEVNKNLQAFAVGILGIGGLMGFALWLFLMGKGLSALGIDLREEGED